MAMSLDDQYFTYVMQSTRQGIKPMSRADWQAVGMPMEPVEYSSPVPVVQRPGADAVALNLLGALSPQGPAAQRQPAAAPKKDNTILYIAGGAALLGLVAAVAMRRG